jgi:hypothetical protein
MRSFKTIMCAALIMCATIVTAEDKAKSTHLDATGGNTSEYQLVYIGNSNTADTTKGTALVSLRKAGKQEFGYGLYMDEKTDKVGTVDAKQIASFSKKDDAKASIITIEVTEEQYMKAKAMVKKYTDKTKFLVSPGDVALNCFGEQLQALKFRSPYRSGLRPPNPVLWITDIPANNRKLIIE